MLAFDPPAVEEVEKTLPQRALSISMSSQNQFLLAAGPKKCESGSGQAPAAEWVWFKDEFPFLTGKVHSPLSLCCLPRQWLSLGEVRVLPRAHWMSGRICCRNWRRLRSCWRCSVGRFPSQRELEVGCDNRKVMALGTGWSQGRAGALPVPAGGAAGKRNGKPVTEGALLGALGQPHPQEPALPARMGSCSESKVLGIVAENLCSLFWPDQQIQGVLGIPGISQLEISHTPWYHG